MCQELVLRALKKSAELSDYTDFDLITQIFQYIFICVIGIESVQSEIS